MAARGAGGAGREVEADHRTVVVVDAERVDAALEGAQVVAPTTSAREQAEWEWKVGKATAEERVRDDEVVHHVEDEYGQVGDGRPRVGIEPDVVESHHHDRLTVKGGGGGADRRAREPVPEQHVAHHRAQREHLIALAWWVDTSNPAAHGIAIHLVGSAPVCDMRGEARGDELGEAGELRHVLAFLPATLLIPPLRLREVVQCDHWLNARVAQQHAPRGVPLERREVKLALARLDATPFNRESVTFEAKVAHVFHILLETVPHIARESGALASDDGRLSISAQPALLPRVPVAVVESALDLIGCDCLVCRVRHPLVHDQPTRGIHLGGERLVEEEEAPEEEDERAEQLEQTSWRRRRRRRRGRLERQ
eukprot:scaffold23283_cov39-Tisochrysis_lutea.AAC.1